MQNLSGQQTHIRLVFENTQPRLYHDMRHYMVGGGEGAEISKIGIEAVYMYGVVRP